MTRRKRTYIEDSKPVRGVGYLHFMRSIEQSARDKPRIGESTAIAEEPVKIGQDPFMGFPATDFARMDDTSSGVPEVRNNVIGLFGPQGALPLDITEEAYRWARMGDFAFVHFTDIFSTRFQQLYFRAWSNARAITQFDHPAGGRFSNYVGALLGIGTEAFLNRNELDDLNKLALAPLAVGRVRSPRKLQQMLETDLGADVRIEEHVPVWINFEEDAKSALGTFGALGRDLYVGSRVQSVAEKIIIHIHTRDRAEYRSFLPGGQNNMRLYAIVSWYLGLAIEVDVSLTLPAGAVEPPKIGTSVELGWMAVLEARDKPHPDTPIQGATYALNEAA